MGVIAWTLVGRDTKKQNQINHELQISKMDTEHPFKLNPSNLNNSSNLEL